MQKKYLCVCILRNDHSRSNFLPTHPKISKGTILDKNWILLKKRNENIDEENVEATRKSVEVLWMMWKSGITTRVSFLQGGWVPDEGLDSTFGFVAGGCH